LASILDQVKSGNTSAATSLSSLGITANPQGTYNTNSTKLGNALSAGLDTVTNFFGGTHGIATQLDGLIAQYTQAGGLLDSINQGLQSGLSDVARQQSQLDARLKTYAATLTLQYNAMDNAVALLKQTQTFLTAEFNPSALISGSSANSSLSGGTLHTGG
jgi:flagellar capping protein FliD